MTVRNVRKRWRGLTLTMALALTSSCNAAGDDQPEGDEQGHEEGHGVDEADPVIRLTEAAILRSGIRVAPVSVGVISALVEVPADVQLNPDRVAHVAPLVPGQLREVRVTTGDSVEAGQGLAVLRSIELGQARATQGRANAMVDAAETNFERQERLHGEGITSERAYLEALLQLEEARAEQEAARARLQVYGVRGGRGPDMTIEAPVAGRIIERHATQGETVSPDDVLFLIADLSRVWVIGQVYEQDVAALREGMTATLTLSAYPGRQWNGAVTWIGATLDVHTRTLPVRIELENPDGLLRPGLFGTLRLAASASTDAAFPLVPEMAVQEVGGRSVVFVPMEGEAQFRAVSILTGARSGGLVEVLDGLEPDARVVVEGAFILKSELMRGELGEGHAH